VKDQRTIISVAASCSASSYFIKSQYEVWR